MAYPKALPTQTNFWRDHQALFSEGIFVIVVMIWGVTFIFSKDALQVVGPFAYNTIRMLVGAITLAIMVGRDWQSVGRIYLWPSLVTGFILFGSYAVQAYGMQFTTASKAGFLTGTNLVYVPILSAWLLRRAPSRTAVSGVILAFIGLYLISFEGGLGGLTIAPGDFWVAWGGAGLGPLHHRPDPLLASSECNGLCRFTRFCSRADERGLLAVYRAADGACDLISLVDWRVYHRLFNYRPGHQRPNLGDAHRLTHPRGADCRP